MGNDIRDPTGMNDEELVWSFRFIRPLDLHQQKLDKTRLLKYSYETIAFIFLNLNC